MSEMVDRGAAAIRDVAFREFDEQGSRERDMAFARAVIKSLREPTTAMVEKSHVNSPQLYGVIGPIVWRAMIDEALR